MPQCLDGALSGGLQAGFVREYLVAVPGSEPSQIGGPFRFIDLHQPRPALRWPTHRPSGIVVR